MTLHARQRLALETLLYDLENIMRRGVGETTLTLHVEGLIDRDSVNVLRQLVGKKTLKYEE